MKNEKYKILLVDDDETLCALLSEFLQEEGFEVETLHSGNAANVTDVMVAGDWLVRDRRPTRVEASAVVAEAQHVAEGLWRRARG